MDVASAMASRGTSVIEARGARAPLGGLGDDRAPSHASVTHRRRGAKRRYQGLGALLLTSPFLVLLLVGGIIPAGYAIVQSFQQRNSSAFGGLSAYQTITSDFRFWPSFIHIGLVLAVWLPLMMIGVVGLSLLLHNSSRRVSSIGRFVYYLPGALAGMANFVLWLFILDPTESPIKPLLHALGFANIDQVASPGNLPFILAAMLFFEGAGTWILIVYGGLNGISEEVLEAARLEGASARQVSWHIKLPLIKKWIAYAALMNVAYGFQLFLEPYVLGLATEGLISPTWTPNELTYTYAFQVNNVPAAAALSVILLVISLAIGLVIITKSGLFSTD